MELGGGAVRDRPYAQWTGKSIVVGLLVLAFGGAVALYHLVEKPARKWMRRMDDVDTAVTESNGSVQESPPSQRPKGSILQGGGLRACGLTIRVAPEWHRMLLACGDMQCA